MDGLTGRVDWLVLCCCPLSLWLRLGRKNSKTSFILPRYILCVVYTFPKSVSQADLTQYVFFRFVRVIVWDAPECMEWKYGSTFFMSLICLFLRVKKPLPQHWYWQLEVFWNKPVNCVGMENVKSKKSPSSPVSCVWALNRIDFDSWKLCWDLVRKCCTRRKYIMRSLLSQWKELLPIEFIPVFKQKKKLLKGVQ